MKEYEGIIEKEFTIVFFCDVKFKDDKPEYFLRLSGEGLSAKCPPDIFGEGIYKIPNDGKYILQKVYEFTGEEEKIGITK